MTAPADQIRIWDLPVRLVHWLLVLLLPAMWLSAENSLWNLHKIMGITIVLLVVFRIVWGIIGSDTARFANFVKGPLTVLAYLRGEGGNSIGHSPIGALSVAAMFAAILTQATLGLFAGDPYDGAKGPLNHLVGARMADTLTEWHEAFYFVVYGLIGLHLAAVAYYALIKRRGLIAPMISGKGIAAGVGESAEGEAGNSPTNWKAAIVALAIALALGVWIVTGAPPLS